VELLAENSGVLKAMVKVQNMRNEERPITVTNAHGTLLSHFA
jgi:hypothetical protein